MKKISRRSFLLSVGAASLAATAVACSSESTSTATSTSTDSTTSTDDTAAASPVDVTLWTFPIGSWGDEETLNSMIANFNTVYPDINVSIQLLDYTNGDDQVTSAIQGGTTPDMIMEGPERLVSNWGAAGVMVDLADLWDDASTSDISAVSESVVSACFDETGASYEYPLCMTTHTMAINYDVFEAADALQYLDVENRTWTTDGYVAAMEAVAASGAVVTPGIVYCGGVGGDQGTRALVNNLYSGTYTDAAHTEYTINSAENVAALNLLKDMVANGSISSDASFVASDELQAFANGTCATTICWNASNEAAYASQVAFTPYAMAFPSDEGVAELCGGIWGFGVFDNGDDAKIEAAKTFIKFMTEDASQAVDSVVATGFFPVRSSLGDVYTGTEKESTMAAYVDLMQYLGDYYNVTPNWTEQRTAWWNMLQQLFDGGDAQEVADAFCETVNIF
ncbi:MAG: extracellular solute-binding protein [Faecalibacterium sp.]